MGNKWQRGVTRYISITYLNDVLSERESSTLGQGLQVTSRCKSRSASINENVESFHTSGNHDEYNAAQICRVSLSRLTVPVKNRI